MHTPEPYEDLVNEKTRSGRYYKEGRAASKDDIDIDDCPYPPRIGTGTARVSWMCGWYDYKFELFWSHWLKKQTVGDKAILKKILLDIDIEHGKMKKTKPPRRF